ncbi:hypothetical protein HU200_049161 [Digitaria exilis]|uniref:F-box domain-containing protein n=1 Tax=Digitaria exilis TaxID=1010633 RepID=A0A835AU48_9POAL|nr:hypothetical protein HU200_049161 [Digitaria exilis]
MRLRSGRRLVSPPPAPQGGRRRRHLRPSEEDWINSLPEDLLLQVLCRLRNTASAARAGAVCRRWRGLWTKLPKMTFPGFQPRLLKAVLAKVTRPRLHLLDITLTFKRGAQVSSLLRAATPLAPEKLRVYLRYNYNLEYDPIELPCLDRTSCLALHLMFNHLLPPPSGEFTALKSLSLDFCRVGIGALLPLCPCLRVLKLRGLDLVDTLIVHSPLLKKFSYQTSATDICRNDIAAPVLKKVTLEANLAPEFSLSYLAPMVKALNWVYRCDSLKVGVNGPWILDSLHRDLLDAQSSFAQMIDQLPVTAFSKMKLKLHTEGHTFGPLVLHLLGFGPVIQELKIAVARNKSSNWRNENIFLTNLEVLEIHGLQGVDDEVDFLRLMLRSAAVLRRLTIRFSNDVSPSDNGYKKIRRAMKEYSGVKYHVHSI